MDELGTHGLSCHCSEGRLPRHAAVNDIICQVLISAGVPSRLEPAGLCRSNDKRPNGISTIPWSNGKILLWDATCPDTYAPSHLEVATNKSGAVED